MKRIFTILLALAMVLGLCACGTAASPAAEEAVAEEVPSAAALVVAALDNIY